MRRGLFALLVVAGFVSVVVGVVMAFVGPAVNYPGTQSIPTYGIIGSPDGEILVDEGLRARYVDARGFVPIVAGAGLLSVAFLGRLRKK